jgi:hypothetical protein
MEGLHSVDVFCPNLYLTSGSMMADGAVLGGMGSDAKGIPKGNNFLTYFNSTATHFYIKAIFQTEIDLTGLEHQVIAPLALQTYQAESPGIPGKSGTGYFRDFTWITTRPLDPVEMIARVDDFSPAPPYMGQNTAGGTDRYPMIAKEQLFLGRAGLWAQDSTLDALLGFMRPLWGQDWNIGNAASTAKLYYTRVIYAVAEVKTSGTAPAFYLDMPARHDQIVYAPVEVSENTEAMTMIRSYQSPQGPE